jgi:RNA polymerase I-associated factor PAF67
VQSGGVGALIQFAYPDSRYGEKRQRMVLGDAGVFDELFSYACPKFITAAPPNYDAPVSVPATDLKARCRPICRHHRGGPLIVSELGLLILRSCFAGHAPSITRTLVKICCHLDASRQPIRTRRRTGCS